MDNELILFDRLNVIKDTINKYGEENFYLSFSGGKDSTILHYLIDMALPNNRIPRVFSNTGIEYLKIVEFVKSLAEKDDRIEIIQPSVNIKKMLEEKGYPFKSKDHSSKLSMFQQNKEGRKKYIKRYLDGINSDGTPTKFACPTLLKYQFTEDFKLKVSDRCCFELKKKPSHKWAKENKKTITITGMRSEEGGQRTHLPCFSKITMKFNPLVKVSEDWEDWFIDKYQIRLCDLYYPPFNFKRTGCKGCPYSLSLSLKIWRQCGYFYRTRESNARLSGNLSMRNIGESDTD